MHTHLAFLRLLSRCTKHDIFKDIMWSRAVYVKICLVKASTGGWLHIPSHLTFHTNKFLLWFACLTVVWE